MTTIAIDVHDRICQDLHQQIRSMIVENERLKAAAQQALDALEGGADSWQLVGPAIDALKEALVEDAMQKFTDVNQELEAALAEPVQEPDPSRCPKCGGPADNGHDREVPPNAYHCTKCMAEPVARRWGYRSVTTGEMDWRGYVEIAAHPNLRSPAIIMEPLYTAPPQRKPLTEEEIDSIWDSEKAFADIYAIVRTIERAHGIGG